MLRRTLKLAWFKRNRYLLTVIAIALSVAFIVSTLLLTTSVSDVGEPLNEAYQDVDTVLTGAVIAEADGPQGEFRGPVPSAVLEAVQASGIDAVGFSEPYAQVLDADGNPGGQAQAASNVAEPWLGDSELNGFAIVAGSAPDNGQVALDEATADSAGFEVGDTISYVTDSGLREAELSGIVAFGGADNDPYTSTLLLDRTDDIFEVENGYSYVLIAGPGTSEETTTEITALPAVSGTGLSAETGQEWITGEIDALNSFLGFFETFLTVFAVIAVVVGMVIVTNTFSVSLAQRTQELALLRLVGTTRRQLMSQVVVEAVLLGLAGTALGIVLGILGVNAMGAFLDLLGLVIERSNAIAPSALIIGAIVGVGVTVAAAVWPARKATEVAPIEALRSAEIEPPSAGRTKLGIVTILTLGGLAALIFGVVDGGIIYAGAGIGLLFFALYFGGEFLIRFVARSARPLLGLFGPTGIIASRNLERNAGRTAAAASALMIGVSLIGFFTLMAATIGQFIAGDAAEALTADYAIQGVGNPAPAIVSDDIVNRLNAVDGVSTVVPVFTSPVTPLADAQAGGFGPGGDSLTIGMADVGLLATVFDFEVLSGSVDDINSSAVLIDEATADSFTLSVGSTLEVTGAAGDVELQVAAIVTSALPGNPAPAVIGALDLRNAFGSEGPATVGYLDATATEAALTDAVGVPTVDVLTNDDYIGGLSANLDTILALVYALLAVAVIIALVGIANTVSLAISERAGEIAASRAAGASIRQIFWSLISEFSLLAFVGVVTGLVFAWVAATGFFQALSNGQISFPETSLVTGGLIILAGLAGGVAATWFPARSASRADLLGLLRAD